MLTLSFWVKIVGMDAKATSVSTSPAVSSTNVLLASSFSVVVNVIVMTVCGMSMPLRRTDNVTVDAGNTLPRMP